MAIDQKEKHRYNIKALLKKKASLLVETTAIRIINGEADGFKGLSLDKYNNSYQIQIFDLDAENQAIEVAEAIAPDSDFTIVKWRTERNGLSLEKFQKSIFKEGPSKQIVIEDGLKFEVDLEDAVNPGLFLDMRANRVRMKKFFEGKKVANGFSYTCSFGVHARSAGAILVDNIDISQKVLDRGKRNYELNGFDFDQDFNRHDSLDFLAGRSKKSETYDVIVLDPPTFSRNKNKTFKVDRDLEDMIALALDCLVIGGILFFSTNCTKLNEESIRKRVGRLAKARGEKLKIHFRINQDEDFSFDPENPTSHLAGFCLEKK